VLQIGLAEKAGELSGNGAQHYVAVEIAMVGGYLRQ
jgi:hypothetical protein